jgi:hypothetical protein
MTIKIGDRDEITVNHWPAGYFKQGEPASKTLDIMRAANSHACPTCQCTGYVFFSGYMFQPNSDDEMRAIISMNDKERRAYVIAHPEQIVKAR